MKSKYRFKRVTASVALIAITIITFAATSSAALPNLSRSYSTNNSLPVDSLVSVVKGQTDLVEAANTNNQQNLVGVVVNSNQSLLAVNPSSNTVQVAIDGSVNVLVSTANGNITKGQQVGVSPFNGIGMKAGAGNKYIGTAQTDFNNTSSGASTVSVKDAQGRSHQLIVGYVRVTIAIGSTNNTVAFSRLVYLQQYLEGLTHHQITIIQLLVCLLIAVLAIVSIVTLIYAATYGSVVSIGRNPLAKYTVLRSLAYIIVMVIFIAGVSGLIIYLILF